MSMQRRASERLTLGDDKATHEENAQHRHEAHCVGNHDVATQGAHHAEQADAPLMNEEKQQKEHEESAPRVLNSKARTRSYVEP